MPDWSLVRSPHVVTALDECDRLGHKDFLGRYGFRKARAYTVWRHGTEYDSMAVLGAAYLHATGHPATWDDPAEGEQVAAKVLAALGFDVVELEQPFVAPRTRKAAAPKATTAKAPTAKSTDAEPRTAKTAATKATKATKAPPARTRTVKAEPVVTICPRCYTAVPATGVCDYCD